MIKSYKISVLLLLIPVISFAQQAERMDTLVNDSQVLIVEHDTYNAFESKMIYSIPEPWGRGESCRIKGRIPRGLRIINHLDFEYKHDDEIIIDIRSCHLNHDHSGSSCPIIVTDLRLISELEYFDVYYSSLSMTFSKTERRKRIKEKKFPVNHIVYLIEGLNADVYVIVKKRRAPEFLSVILSGCDLTLTGKTVSVMMNSLEQ